MADTTIVLLDSETGRKIVKKHCRREKISIFAVEELVAAELAQAGKLRKRGLFEKFDDVLDGDLETGE